MLRGINGPDDLTEITVNIPYRDPANDPRNLPEIVVSQPKIPWWMWSIAGSLAFALLNSLVKGKRL